MTLKRQHIPDPAETAEATMFDQISQLSSGEAAVISGLIGAAGTIAAVLLSPFAEDFRNSILRSKATDPLLGRWRATWEADPGSKTDRHIVTDTVYITKVRDRYVEGTGENPEFGDYHLSGKQSQFVVTLSFHGEGRNQDLEGVVILKKGAQRDQMKGVWVQYSPHHELVRGWVDFEKVSA